MPTTDVTNALTATITSTEQSTSNVPINRGTGNPSFNCDFANFFTYLALNNGSNTISMPQIPACQVYVRNLDPAKTVSVSWTPNGGSLDSIIVLNPGDMILFWCNPAGTTTPGITAMNLNASAAGCLVEYFIGG
jgi:hypothetical protein